MNIVFRIFLTTLLLGLSLQMNAAPASRNKILAANCTSKCDSCWEQCAKSSDCDAGQTCASTPCGNRCIK